MTETNPAEKPQSEAQQPEQIKIQQKNPYYDLYKDDKDYADLVPIPDPEDPKLPFYVQHSVVYDDRMSYFRALLENEEFSERGRTLVRQLVTHCPSNINGIWYMTKIYEKFGYKFENEIDFNEGLLQRFHKSYQAWFQRRWLVSRENRPCEDFKMIKRIIRIDVKNFHVWTYCLWYARQYAAYKEVFDLTTEFLEIKPTNNSAWNAREQVSEKAGIDMLEELKFAFGKLIENPNIESACSYIRHIGAAIPNLLETALEMANTYLEANPDNHHAVALNLHLLQTKGDNSRNDELYDRLIVTDPIRARFWQLMKNSDPRFV